MSQHGSLPDSLDACHALLEQVNDTNESLAKAIEQLKFENEQLKRYIYGRRSERHVEDASQLKLFGGEDHQAATTDNDSDTLEEEITYRRQKQRRDKNESFPGHLPREVQMRDVPESERLCPCCGDEMPIIATDVREKLEFIPGRLAVHELHYPKRACGKCKQTVKAASPPEPDHPAATLTSGSRYGFGVTAQIILGKYADHLPLYRMEDIFARAGVVIPRSTQVGLLDMAADLCQPLIELLHKRLLSSHVLGLDDTPVRLQDPEIPGAMRTARMWLCRGRDEAPYNQFFFHESRERDGPASFLQDYRGWVTVDAYGVQDGVYLGSVSSDSDARILASCCHAHARRKFESAKSNDPRRASWALAWYRRLYDIEERGRELSASARFELRTAESRPLLDEFRGWLDEQRANPHVLPKSAIGGAIRYALNQWQSLAAFLSDGCLPIDNNDTERDLRRLTIGRKNWLFIGSSVAGDVAASMYTLVASASRHDLDLWAYLNDVLRRLAAPSPDLNALLPDAWATTHPDSIRTYRQHQRAIRRTGTKRRRQLRRLQSPRQP